MRAPIIVITGPPGAGKTTVASAVADEFEQSAVISGDAFFNFLHKGKIPPWLPASHQQNAMAIEATINAAAHYATNGWTIALEGIFGPWFLPTVAHGAAGFDLHYLVLQAPLETCLERFKQREPESDTDVVEIMHGQFMNAGINARHLVDADRPTPAIAEDVLGRVFQRSTLITAEPLSPGR